MQIYQKYIILIIIAILIKPSLSQQYFQSLVFAGYQGWFSNQLQGALGWKHWSSYTPAPKNITFELYPDLTEYPLEVLQETQLGELGNGQPSLLYSSNTDGVIGLHFSWMQKYGIDGVALQRLVSDLYDQQTFEWRNSVLERISRYSTIYQRYFHIMYDISNAPNDFVDKIQKDFNFIEALYNLKNHEFFVKTADGRPVVNIWGFGFLDARYSRTPSQLKTLCEYFHGKGYYVVLGVPYKWRIGGMTYDFQPEDFLAGDMIQPWTVGSFDNNSLFTADNKALYINDRDWCYQHKIDFQRVIWPGFAWSNWNSGTKNYIPRLSGKFIWNQARLWIEVFKPTVGPKNPCSLYIAMFDDFGVGTAIAKAAPNTDYIPKSQYFLTLDADGEALESDFYLKTTGNIIEYFKKFLQNLTQK